MDLPGFGETPPLTGEVSIAAETRPDGLPILHSLPAAPTAVYLDFDGYQASFLRLFGFGLAGVDYDAETDTAVKVPSIA